LVTIGRPNFEFPDFQPRSWLREEKRVSRYILALGIGSIELGVNKVLTSGSRMEWAIG